MRSAKRVLIVGVLLLVGCAGAGRITRMGKNPVNMTTADRNYLNVILRFTPVAQELSKELAQPVNILNDWDARSITIHFKERKNYCDLLYLDPVDFCRVNEVEPLTPIAVRVNTTGRPEEVGVIVVAKKSKINKLEDLKGKRFAFGPYESAYQFYNVLELFKQEGLPTAQVKALYHPDSLAVAQKVLLGGAEVGVVTQTWWETSTDRTLDLSRLLKDDLRVIAQTPAMPEYVWAVSENVTAENRRIMQNVLTKDLAAKTPILSGFGARGFQPAAEKDYPAVCPRIKRIKNLPPPPSVLPIPVPQ